MRVPNEHDSFADGEPVSRWEICFCSALAGATAMRQSHWTEQDIVAHAKRVADLAVEVLKRQGKEGKTE